MRLEVEEHRCVMAHVFRVGLSAVMLAACVSPNPQSCADGLCTDQRYPFCDADGTFEGHPDTCIAVDCEPSSFVRCLGDEAVKCNATGNDYTLTTCEQGCNESIGCRTCSNNDQCTASAPICDASGACRACVRDDECSSLVCDRGACAAESGVLYASVGGANNTACTKAAPCTAGLAVFRAATAAVQPIVRLLPGSYPGGLVFDRTTPMPLQVVATGVAIVADTPIAVSGGAGAWVRGAELVAQTDAVTCDSTAGASKLRLTDMILGAGGPFTALVRVGRCELTVESSVLRINASNYAAVYLDSDSIVTGDRLRLEGTPTHPATIGSAAGKRMSLTLTNSLFLNAPIQFQVGDTSSPGSRATLGNNTFIFQESLVECHTSGFGTAFRTLVYDNNVVFGTNTTDVVDGAGCQWTNNLVFPQLTGLPGNLVMPPQFADLGAGDYHLSASSPAIDKAIPTARFPTFSADLDGVARPQGAAPDLGAFERVP